MTDQLEEAPENLIQTIYASRAYESFVESELAELMQTSRSHN